MDSLELEIAYCSYSFFLHIFSAKSFIVPKPSSKFFPLIINAKSAYTITLTEMQFLVVHVTTVKIRRTYFVMPPFALQKHHSDDITCRFSAAYRLHIFLCYSNVNVTNTSTEYETTTESIPQQGFVGVDCVSISLIINLTLNTGLLPACVRPRDER